MFESSLSFCVTFNHIRRFEIELIFLVINAFVRLKVSDL